MLLALVVLVVGREIEGALHRIKGDKDAGNRDLGNREQGTGTRGPLSG